MQIVINIAEDIYNSIINNKRPAGCIVEMIDAIKHGKPLEQEPFINKPCVSSGVCEHDKQKVLEKIRAEIERQEKWLMDTGYNACSVDIAFDAIKSVVAESEG